MPSLPKIIMTFLINLDHLIFQQINGLAGKFLFLDAFGIFSAVYLIFIIAAIALCWCLLKKRYKLLLKILSAVIIGYGINHLISLWHFRLRPFAGLEVRQLIEKSAAEKSFPSDHTTIAFIIAFLIFGLNKKLGGLLLIFAILVALSRVFAGVHYPADIAAGIVVAGIVSAIIHYAFRNNL